MRYILLLTACLLALPAHALNVYHVGNSMTQGLPVNLLNQWTDGDYIAGRHIYYGQSLNTIFNNPTLASYVDSYGTFGPALANNSWDVLTVQPYFDSLTTAIARVNDFAALTTAETVIYPPYPWRDWWSTTFDGPHWWTEPYTTGSSNSTFSRSFSNQLAEATGKRYIPSGEVIYQLSHTHNPRDFYGDAVHLNGTTGAFILASTTYATLYGLSPVGLAIPANVDPALGLEIQQVAWAVVAGHKYTGVPATGDYTGDGIVDMQDYHRWKFNFARGITDAAGYTAWRNHFAPLTFTAIPEPPTYLLAIVGILILRLSAGSGVERGRPVVGGEWVIISARRKSRCLD